MRHNGNGHKSSDPTILTNLVIPGVEFSEDSYAELKLRLDCYSDTIVAQKFSKGQSGGLYALDPAQVALAMAGVSLATPLLPKNCLFWQKTNGDEKLGIYCEPQIWAVNVAVGSEWQAWRVPMPGLIWMGQGKSYRLWAVKGSDWPIRETHLYKAPCPNVSEDICRGDVSFPVAGPDTIWAALRLFFESDFNNHLANGKSQAVKDSIVEVWRTLHEAEALVYPEDDLVSTSTTLAGVMK